MIEFFSFVFAVCVLALPWLLWTKLLTMCFDGEVSPFVTLAAVMIGIPVYYYLLLKIL